MFNFSKKYAELRKCLPYPDAESLKDICIPGVVLYCTNTFNGEPTEISECEVLSNPVYNNDIESWYIEAKSVVYGYNYKSYLGDMVNICKGVFLVKEDAENWLKEIKELYNNDDEWQQYVKEERFYNFYFDSYDCDYNDETDW